MKISNLILESCVCKALKFNAKDVREKTRNFHKFEVSLH